MPDDDLHETPSRSTNEDAIRLWLIDMALTHLTRNQGILGLGANATQQSLRVERDEIVARLRKLGDALVDESPAPQRRRA